MLENIWWFFIIFDNGERGATKRESAPPYLPQPLGYATVVQQMQNFTVLALTNLYDRVIVVLAYPG